MCLYDIIFEIFSACKNKKKRRYLNIINENIILRVTLYKDLICFNEKKNYIDLHS